MTAPITDERAHLSLTPQPKAPTKGHADWTYQDARAAVEAETFRFITREAYETNRQIVEDQDHWRDGAGWVGPNGGGKGEIWRQMAADIERQFTPVDVVDEVLTRHANALLKTEPSVAFVPVAPTGPDGEPSEAEAAEADAVERAVSAWWDRVKLWRQARGLARRARWATRACMRVSVDPATLDVTKDGVRALPTGLTLDEALARVQLDTPEPTDAAVVYDPVTGTRVAVLFFASGEGAARVNVVQLWSRSGDAMTVREVEERGMTREFTLPLARLPFAEMSAELMITEPVRRQQARLNFAESTVVRAAETSGFRERHITNAEPVGIWADGPPQAGEDVAKVEDVPGGGVRRLIRRPPTLGSSIVTEHIGLEVGMDSEGGVKRATPGVIVVDPADPEHTLKTSRHSRGTILQSVGQGHVLRASDQVSGYSQEQARTDFVDDATNVKAELEGALRDIIEGALAWAIAMAAPGAIRADFLTRFRCVVTLTINAGPLSEGERAAVVLEYEKGLRARESAMALIGVEDVEAEKQLIAAGGEARLAALKAYAEVLEILARVTSMDAALRALAAAGMDPAVVAALAARDEDGLVEEGDGLIEEPDTEEAA